MLKVNYATTLILQGLNFKKKYEQPASAIVIFSRRADYNKLTFNPNNGCCVRVYFFAPGSADALSLSVFLRQLTDFEQQAQESESSQFNVFFSLITV